MSGPLRIGMFGCGTVGGGVFEILTKRIKYLESVGVKATVAKICVRNTKNPAVIELVKGHNTTITSKYDDILDDPSINCVVELMGGVTDAKDVVFKAIAKNKHVITANKALIANFMPDLTSLLEAHPNVRFGYEASVCGGIPIIHTLQSSYTGDGIKEIAGIMNGTTNYMLSKMEKEGASYDAVLKEAQDLGFAEANPSADVDGFDVQAKIAILAKLGFGCHVPPSTVPTTGITRIKTIDFEYAKLMGATIKLLGIAKQTKPNSADGISVFVSPVIVPLTNVIGTVHGASNIVNIVSDNCINGAYVGQGAGRFPTANSVVNDIVRLAQTVVPIPAFGSTREGVKLENDYEGRFYVRVRLADGLGIVRSIGAHAEEAGISIDSILQLPIHDRNNVDTVVTTDLTKVSQVERMVQALSKLPFVQETPLFLPIL
ncbi:homoserine dehydrogenase [Thraustotheca clavata]|uniref:Homoserine dehydrogenase n=1 Tax=Thraustotheca clavata TaxID=74557 RepID=A0A1V9ZXW6_9STRA|nr:homoserine dehydrogenase [Thraustotheca clavata]